MTGNSSLFTTFQSQPSTSTVILVDDGLTSYVPVLVRLLDKGMNLSTCCVLCGQGQEHYWHLFYDCPYSSSCWAAANVDKPKLTTDEFPV